MPRRPKNDEVREFQEKVTAHVAGRIPADGPAKQKWLAFYRALLGYYDEHPTAAAVQNIAMPTSTWFLPEDQWPVTGLAKVRLFTGRAMQIGAKSPHTLYDPQLASFSMEGYDVTAARGFIDLFGLPMKVASQAKKW